MDPVVLIPGTLCDARVWQHQNEHISNWTDVYIADITKDSSIEEMAARVLKDAPKTFALAGISQGAIVAMELMRQAPGRVSRLALLDTSCGAASPAQIETWQMQLQMVERGEFRSLMRNQFVPALLHKHKNVTAVLNSLSDMTERVGEESFVHQLHANISRPDAREVLLNISCPVLILAGREDAVSSMEKHREMADLIPHAALVFIENCGHLSTVDQPEAVTAVLMYWLQEERKYA